MLSFTFRYSIYRLILNTLFTIDFQGLIRHKLHHCYLAFVNVDNAKCAMFALHLFLFAFPRMYNDVFVYHQMFTVLTVQMFLFLTSSTCGRQKKNIFHCCGNVIFA